MEHSLAERRPIQILHSMEWNEFSVAIARSGKGELFEFTRTRNRLPGNQASGYERDGGVVLSTGRLRLPAPHLEFRGLTCNISGPFPAGYERDERVVRSKIELKPEGLVCYEAFS